MSAMDYENNQEEWKEVWNPSYLKVIAAFYNTNGGRLIIGRRDDGSFAGLPDPKDTAKKISDSIHNKMHINADVRIESMDSKDCVVVEVPGGNHLVDLDSKFYVRVGNTNQILEGDELRIALLGERGMDWLDQTCDYKLDDLSPEAISYFINLGKKHGRIGQNVDPTDIRGVISSYDLSKDNKLTMAAVIAFAKEPRHLNDGAYVVIGQFDSKKILRRETYVEVPGIQLVDETIRILYERYIPSKFEYEGKTALRINVFDYPEDALRELIVNALVHKDYSIKEPTRVAIFPDHIEISSMGLLPKGWKPEDLVKEHPSSRRNRTLANIFHDAGYVEKWGQGIEKVCEVCKTNGNPPPKFSIVLGSLKAKISIKRAEDSSPANTGTLLTGVDSEIVKLISSDPSISQPLIAKKLGIAKSTVARHTSKLVEMGVIKREGSNKNGFWMILLK